MKENNYPSRVGILTQTPSHNYGGVLQALALFNFLKFMGLKPILINKKFYISPLKRFIFNVISMVPGQNYKNLRVNRFRKAAFRDFIKKEFPNITKPIVCVDDLKAVVMEERLDAIIVGSDQVWRYAYINDGNFNVFFLDLGEDISIRKLAYAASFGVDKWEAVDEIPRITKLLDDFDFLSTRERKGVDICKTQLFVSSEVHAVLDPTLLVLPSFYDRFTTGRSVQDRGGYLASYFLDEDSAKRSFSAFLMNKVTLNSQLKLGKYSGDARCQTPDEWLLAIKNARYVITDSFHGMLFAIIFKKPFFVFANDSRGLSRFEDILEILDLQSRLVTTTTTQAALGQLIEEKIDYEVVHRKLESERSRSHELLTRALTR